MAYGVERAFLNDESSTDYDAFAEAEVFNVIEAVTIYYANRRPLTLYVDATTLVPEAICQAMYLRGGLNPDKYSLFGEPEGRNAFLIGDKASLLKGMPETNEELQSITLKKRFSRLTEAERDNHHEVNISYAYSRKLYMRNRYFHEDHVAAQLCFFQISAEEPGMLRDQTTVVKVIHKYIPSQVS